MTIYPQSPARKALKNVRLSTSPFVFVKETGYPYSNKDLNRIWHDAEEKTGIKCKLYNAVRHSLGCQLLDQGIDIGIVREIYGHTRLEMTSRYACHSSHVIDNALADRHKKAIKFKKKTQK